MMRLVIGMLAAALAAVAHSDAGVPRVSRVPQPEVRIERGEACVAPTAEMRRDHMKMLDHQRDRTVRSGLRESRFSLKNCVNCHASGATGSVLGNDGFCASCHTYTSVKIDCFECHSPLRQSKVAGAPR